MIEPVATPLEPDEPVSATEVPPDAIAHLDGDGAAQTHPPIPGISKMPLSQHFDLAEFSSHDGAPFPPPAVANLGKLAQVLEAIRAHFGGKPVRILSGYRSPAHNRAVGGAPASQHLYGTAADIVIQGVAPGHVAEFAASLPQVGGVGCYTGQGFTHVDVRYRSGRPVTRWEG